MRILSLIHQEGTSSGLLEQVAAVSSHELEQWSLSWGRPPRSIGDYAAVVALGGSMNAHDEATHPWLREETAFLRGLLNEGVPVLGVCLGGQLLAKAAEAPVARASRPEIGWYEVELTPEAREDPVFHVLPDRFVAYQWHSYQFELPERGVALATNPVCLQAFRLGDCAWGVQFHPEMTKEIATEWIAIFGSDEDARVGFEAERALLELDRHIGRWNELGSEFCSQFFRVAEEADR